MLNKLKLQVIVLFSLLTILLVSHSAQAKTSNPTPVIKSLGAVTIITKLNSKNKVTMARVVVCLSVSDGYAVSSVKAGSLNLGPATTPLPGTSACHELKAVRQFKKIPSSLKNKKKVLVRVKLKSNSTNKQYNVSQYSSVALLPGLIPG